MGMVFEAEQVETGRRVALKILSHGPNLPEARKRFLREGRLAASVSHPNLVYIFGTEEIEGSLVIAMELIGGGTLKDRISRDGPLPIRKAVDVCLQLIEGLEAAAAAGVLHRDIKPSNCFVDSDGVVKVGDFGLSISTLAKGETQLTMTGSFVGTPAYSSPEQLRGEDLDVRSDIYAVGVTLYFLLTGKTPFEGDNFVKMLATVLEKTPESPARLRREIPRGLANAVLRCLAKKPAQRFKNYAEFRTALQPFASSAPRPASLNLRGGAGILDLVIVTFAVAGLFSLPMKHWGPRPWGLWGMDPLGLGVSYVTWIAYYSISEGIWAASPGKAVSKLRLVRLDGGRATVADALIRALWIILIPAVPFILVDVLYRYQIGRGHEGLMTWCAMLANLLFFGLLFLPARKRNGYAGFHDRFSKTRVVTLPPPGGERVWIQPPSEAITEGEFPFKIGPYQSASALDQAADLQVLAGYDQKLLRKVWIQRMPAGAPPVSPVRQKLSRATRVRWIGGRRSTEENWDAYEAVSGRPLISGEAKPASWSQVRYWLLDLAEEIEAGTRTQTMVPVLNTDRVWIGADGRVKLLDVLPAPIGPVEKTEPSSRVGDESTTVTDLPATVDTQKGKLFLNQVALAALEGPAGQKDTANFRAPAVPMPLHARQFLEEMSRFPSWDALIQELKELLSRPAAVTKKARQEGLWVLALPFLLCGPFVFLFSLIGTLLFRGGYGTRRMGVDFVTRDGSPASRARILWRNFVAGLPSLIIYPVVSGFPEYTAIAAVASALIVVILVLGFLRCLKVPERSYADCLAGTWMVPR
jgi:uncharacterized RDD family membrane protein YckC